VVDLIPTQEYEEGFDGGMGYDRMEEDDMFYQLEEEASQFYQPEEVAEARMMRQRMTTVMCLILSLGNMVAVMRWQMACLL